MDDERAARRLLRSLAAEFCSAFFRAWGEGLVSGGV